MGANILLQNQYDERRRKQRAEEDQYLSTQTPGGPGMPNSIMAAFNRNQTDAAVGPGGYNRQWVPLLEEMQHKRLGNIGGGLPLSSKGGAVMDDPKSSFNTQQGPFGGFGEDPAMGGLPQGEMDAGPPLPAQRLKNAVSGLKKGRTR
jgi:hypothetical protein